MHHNAGAFRREEWCKEAYYYTDRIGELGYIAHLVANTGARGELRVQRMAELDENNNPKPKLISGELAENKKYGWVNCHRPTTKKAMREFTGRTGGQRELKRRAFLGLFIAGETHLVGIPDPKDGIKKDRIWYEFLSSMELEKDSETGGLKRIGVRKKRQDGLPEDLTGSGGEPLPKKAFLQRLHRPHHAISGDPDSPVRRVIDICKELLLLTQMIEAQAKSRLSAGILYVPHEISFGPDDKFEGGAGNDDELDEVEEALIEHMSAPVQDRTSTAGMVPLVFRGPADQKDNIHLIDVTRPISAETSALRQELLQRLAQGIDVPPEYVNGKGNSNHWGQVSLDKDLILKHVVPTGDLFADFVLESYFQPAIIADGVTQAEAAWYRIVYDVSTLIGREDAGPSSRALFDRDALSEEAMMRANGYDPEVDLADEDEKRIRFRQRLIERKTADDARKAILLLDEMGYWEGLDLEMPEPLPEEESDNSAKNAVDDSNEDIADREKVDGDPADDTQTREEPDQPDTTASIVLEQLHAAAEMAMGQALERAANRLFSQADKAKYEARAGWRQMTFPEALADCGRAGLADMNIDGGRLFDGAWNELSRKGRRWVRDVLEASGVDRVTADSDAVFIVNEICMSLEVLAQAAFESPLNEDPATGYRVPRALVENSLGVANVGPLTDRGVLL